jgi:hypothetical protein
MEYLRVQLKVCEGCGGLWFRTETLAKVYCTGCTGKMAGHAKARLEDRPGRRAKHGSGAQTQVQLRGGAQ